MTECSIDPSGVFSSGYSDQVSHIGWSFQPSTGAQVSPASSLRNSPCGLPPAYQTPGSSGWPGVSQNTLRRLRASRSPVWNAGGREASDQVAPKSVVRNSVGPRCPVPAATSRVRPSRGSSTACWTMWPRKWGPSTDQDRRPASAVRIHAPLRVPRNRAVVSVTGATVVMRVGPHPGSELIGRAVGRWARDGPRQPPHPRAGAPGSPTSTPRTHRGSRCAARPTPTAPSPTCGSDGSPSRSSRSTWPCSPGGTRG